MTSRSRLGKGLGALFPALPGEDDETNADNNSRRQDNKVPNSSNKQPIFQGLGAESNEQKRLEKDDTTKGKAKSERSTQHSDRAGSELADSAKSSKSGRKRTNAGQKRVSISKSIADDVSRETLTSKRTTKRRSVPSISSLEHPSDLFFGPTTTNVSRETSPMMKSSDAVDDRTKEAPQSVNRAVPVGNDTELNKAEGNTQEKLEPVQGGYLAEVRVDDIRPNAQQPRQIFDEDELLELSRSIKEVGVLQPIVVRRSTLADYPRTTGDKTTSVVSAGSKSKAVDAKTGEERSGQLLNQGGVNLRQTAHYEIIMGERRWRATRLAGLDTIPAIVKTTSDDTMLRDALLENLHRVALNPLEEAAAYQQMIDEFGLTQDGLSKSISKSRPQITNTLRLLKLPPSVQKKVSSGVLSAGHARALLTLPDEKSMTALADKIIAEGLSVRSTEELVALQTGQAKKKAKKPRVNAWADSPVRQDLESHFDTKVAIKGTKKHGKIEIVFSSPEDMDRIVGILLEKDQSRNNGNRSGDKGWV